MRVANILKAKGTAVMTVRPNESMHAVTKRFQQEKVGALIVIGDGGCLQGIIYERDVVNGVATYGADFIVMPASALMTTEFATCSPDSSVADVARVMTERRLRHVPVMAGKRLIGIVSVGDILRSRVSEIQLEANVLRDIAIAAR